MALILNQKSNEYIVLEKDAAYLWEFLLNSPNYDEVINFAKENDFFDEFDNFLKELLELGLVRNNLSQLSSLNKQNNSCLFSEEKQLEFFNFQSDLFNFIEQKGYLPRLFIELTYNCNLNCIHCFEEKSSKYIKFDEIKTVIDEAEELGVFYITLSGGECTLDPDLIKIAEYIRKKRIALDLFTNGQVLYDNKQLLDKIIKLNPSRISLSLYSMYSKIHDKITGVKGSFAKTMFVIKYLKSNSINVEIKHFITNLNINNHTLIQNFAKSENINYSIDYRLLDNPKKTNRNIKIKNNQLLNMLLNENSCLHIKNEKPIDINNINNDRICNGGYIGLLINPNLDIYICPALKILLGNCKTDSLKKIWMDKSQKSVLYKIKSYKKSDIEGCFKHDYCQYCTYCPGIAYAAGYYMRPYKDFCEEAEIKMKAVNLYKQNASDT